MLNSFENDTEIIECEHRRINNLDEHPRTSLIYDDKANDALNLSNYVVLISIVILMKQLLILNY